MGNSSNPSDVTPQIDVSVEIERALRELDEVLYDLPVEIEEIGRAFRTNIDGVFHVIDLPHKLVSSTLFGEMKEREKSELENVRERVKNTEGLFQKGHTFSGGVKNVMNRQVERLESLPEKVAARGTEAVERPAVKRAISEVILQGVVLTWSAVEVLASDLFPPLLNKKPKLVLELEADPRTKNTVPVPDWGTLEKFEFDLGSRLGDLHRDRIPSDVEGEGFLLKVKNLCNVVFCNDRELKKALSDRDLWLLFLRRNLIVHRRGVVDERYVERSGEEELSLGSKIPVALDDIGRYLIVALDAGRLLLLAASETLKND